MNPIEHAILFYLFLSITVVNLGVWIWCGQKRRLYRIHQTKFGRVGAMLATSGFPFMCIGFVAKHEYMERHGTTVLLAGVLFLALDQLLFTTPHRID
jgi:hypothetical protein